MRSSSDDELVWLRRWIAGVIKKIDDQNRFFYFGTTHAAFFGGTKTIFIDAYNRSNAQMSMAQGLQGGLLAQKLGKAESLFKNIDYPKIRIRFGSDPDMTLGKGRFDRQLSL